MRFRLFVLLSGVGFGLAAAGGPSRPEPIASPQGVSRPAEFDPPELLLDGSEFAAGLHPHYADFDGDGKVDQLVGVGNRLLVYRNEGTSARPVYANPTWFDAAVPSAVIPDG